jgi:hypothetical protein
MNMRALCARYQQAVSSKDLASVEALFLPGALVATPIRGEVGVRDFHAYMFEHVKQGAARFPNVFREKTNPSRISLQFSYTFLMQSATLGGVDGVAEFEYDDDWQRFRRLRIEYDASGIRRLLEAENISVPGQTNELGSA